MKKDDLETNWKPTPSNSRLGAHLLCTYPEITFDRFSIMGDLFDEFEEELADFLAIDEDFSLFDCGTSRFKARAFEDKVYIEYDKIMASTFKKRNFRIEFNPSKLSNLEKNKLKLSFLKKLDNVGFTRIDLAFDFDLDLSSFYALVDAPLKKTLIFGRDGRVETKYFGSRESDRYIRIYNKKKERLENADVLIDKENFWRLEFELKKKFIDNWKQCFEDVHFIQPAINSVKSIQERAMLNFLMQHEEEWGNLNRNSKRKYKNLLLEISDIDLLELIKFSFSQEVDRLEKELKFWLRRD